MEKMLDEIFKSEERVRILRVLKGYEELNISVIVRFTQLDHLTALEHLTFLSKEGVVHLRKFGTVRIYSLQSRGISKLTEKVWERLSER